MTSCRFEPCTNGELTCVRKSTKAGEMLISSGNFWKWQETKSFPFLTARFDEPPRLEAVERLEVSGGREEEEPEVMVDDWAVDVVAEDDSASLGWLTCSDAFPAAAASAAVVVVAQPSASAE